MESIEDVVFYSIDKCIKTYRQYAQRKLQEAGHTITIDQWLVLSLLDENPEISQNEIAAKVFKDPASITRIIELLQKSGMISKVVHPRDKRRTEIRITPFGEHELAGVRSIVKSNRSKALQGLEAHELKTLNRLLGKMITNCHIPDEEQA